MRLSADDQAERSSASLGAVGQRFCKKLVRSPRASNGNRGGEFQPPVAMVKTKALKHRLIQFNGPRYISYLLFDVDRPAAALAWQDANLPCPTLIVENPRNTFAHYAYELATPVRLDNERAASLEQHARRAVIPLGGPSALSATRSPGNEDGRSERRRKARPAKFRCR